MSKVPQNLFLFICNKHIEGSLLKEPNLAVGYFISEGEGINKPTPINSLGRAYWNRLDEKKKKVLNFKRGSRDWCRMGY